MKERRGKSFHGIRSKKDFRKEKAMIKIKVKEIVAHNGISVLIAQDTAYHHTEFDEIMAAWREQEYQRKQLERQQQQKNRNIFSLFKRKKAA